MEEKLLKVNQENRDLLLSQYRLFEWQLVKEEKKGHLSYLYLVRDNSTPYYQQLIKLEEEYGKIKYIPMPFIIILAGFAMIIISILLIFYLTNRDFAKTYWYIFIIGASIFLIASVFLTFMRLRTLEFVTNKKSDKDKLYLQKIKTIKDNK